ncbi:thiamine pyrophosphate-binding protein, partial [Agromyces seonyuensis]
MPDPAPLSAASEHAFALLAEFAAIGVSDVVVAPGSRSQALALAAAELERVGALRLHVRIDERDAGFLALGLALESGRPSLIVTTSGTAVANLHPAILEAHHAGVPIIALTADRPAALRGTRANQTTRQPGIFGPMVRFERDEPAVEAGAVDVPAVQRLARHAYAAALGTDDLGNRIASPGAGPVHLNLQYSEPLSTAVRLERAPLPRPFAPKPPLGRRSPVPPMPGTIVVAGAGAGPARPEERT